MVRVWGCCIDCAESVSFSAVVVVLNSDVCSGSGQDEGVFSAVLLMHLFVLAQGWPLQMLIASLFCKHRREHLLAGVAAPLCGRLWCAPILSTGVSVLAACLVVDEIVDMRLPELSQQGMARSPWRLSVCFLDHSKSYLCSKQDRELLDSS